MSASLTWEPAISKVKGYLPIALRLILEKSYGIRMEPTKLGKESLPYLNGLKDAGVEGALELIDLIEKHEAVILKLEY